MDKHKPKNWKYQVNAKEAGAKFIGFAAKVFPILGSKSAVKKAIAEERLYINGKIARYTAQLKRGDLLELKAKAASTFKKYDIDLEIVYEDDFLIIVNKPGGIAVNGSRNKTVEHALLDKNKSNRQPDALPNPIAIHRIDLPTKGLVLFAKTKTAQIQLSKAFQQNTVKKTYFAVVHGRPHETGIINHPIAGKQAITEFERVQLADSQVFGHLSLVKLHPITGRTHQLRIHLKEKGHLIVGDKQYAGAQKTILGKGLFLCACQLAFTHPITKEALSIHIDVPTKFKKLLQREQDRFQGTSKRPN